MGKGIAYRTQNLGMVQIPVLPHHTHTVVLIIARNVE